MRSLGYQLVKSENMKIRPESKSKGRNIALWALQIVVALAFLAAGVSKLTAQPEMVAVFEQIGIGQWPRYLTGGIEVISAVLLFVPRLAPIGALLLVGTMAGAVLTHLAFIGGSPVPALVLLILAAIIAWGRREKIALLINKSPGISKPGTD